MRILISTLFLLTFSAVVLAQNPKLANQYYNDREFYKAAELYKRMYEEGNNKAYNFDRYILCLNKLKKYDEAEAELRKRLKSEPHKSSLYVNLGELLELTNKLQEANQQYRLALEMLNPNRTEILKLGNSFRSKAKFDLAIETYVQGIELMNDTFMFAYQLGDLYGQKGDVDQMIVYYLYSINDQPQRAENVKGVFQRKLQPEDHKILQAQLYDNINRYPEVNFYPELLEWSFIQQKDYYNALRQARALDRKLNENGARVYNIGQVAMGDRDYETAIKAFEYIIDQEGVNSSYYIVAKQMLLDSRRKQLYFEGTPSEDQLRTLEQEYLDFLDEFGITPRTAIVLSELARFEAWYMKDIDKAVEYLQQLIGIPGANTYLKANAKLDLGDFYLLRGERWEATLLYSQVDKMFPDEMLGEEARFRNAKLSYYVGDFEWAQQQFDILKAATSRLIANDAIDLSVFIMDNLGLDTTALPLEMFAHAELLVFQEYYNDASDTLDNILKQFPGHGLEDDVLYLKAHIFVELQDYKQAETAYLNIIENYPKEIRGDNAIYELAELYDYRLDRKEEAMQLYEKLFIEYPGSVLAVEARKRYRVLRGDFS